MRRTALQPRAHAVDIVLSCHAAINIPSAVQQGASVAENLHDSRVSDGGQVENSTFSQPVQAQISGLNLRLVCHPAFRYIRPGLSGQHGAEEEEAQVPRRQGDQSQRRTAIPQALQGLATCYYSLHLCTCIPFGIWDI